MERRPEFSIFPRLRTTYLGEAPARRPLKIFAKDPLSGRTIGNRQLIDVPNEDLRYGPSGDRIKVIDYDGTLDCYYAPLDLNDPAVLMGNGLEPSESDPRFHQQMVYAVAMRVLENFERALGRRVSFANNRPLRILPHAFRGANAFFDPNLNAVLFGYFSADEVNPGANLPGQIVFTCLSHDIVAHEVTHAIVFRLREYYSTPTNRDVLAFHEAVADIVAIFQHFTFPDVLRSQIQKTHNDLRAPGPLLELAGQFGYATGRNGALRSALGPEASKPDPRAYQTALEPHARGSLLVEAIFDTFFTTYQHRIEELVRVATGGTGQLPPGDLHPDLVGLLSLEASRAAQSVLSMCIRAFEYLPPVDVTYGDYLRALVTADFELYPNDTLGQRAALIEAFRLRGIYPHAVASLSEDSLVWSGAEQQLPPFDRVQITRLIATRLLPAGAVPQPEGSGESPPADEGATHVDDDGHAEPGPMGSRDRLRSIAKALVGYANAHREALQLDLDPDIPVRTAGFHPTLRIGENGRVRVDIIVQFVQKKRLSDEEKGDLGGLPIMGGTTVVFSDDGAVRYLVAKPLPREEYKDDPLKADRSLNRMREFVEESDEGDELLMWRDSSYFQRRMLERSNLSGLHRHLGEA